MKRRFMSLLLVFAMVLTVFPTTAMALEPDEQTPAETEVAAIDDTAAQVDDQAAADAVIAQIEAIGGVTLESETAITEAYEAYESLTEAQKALVTNYETLTAAMEALSVLKVVAADDGTEDSSTEEGTPVDPGYDIVTGDTDSQGTQRVRVKNINISGVDVIKHQKTGDFSAVVILPADTDKEAELTFTLDCIGNPNIANGKIFVNNAEAGTMTAKEGSNTEGTWTYSMVPQWDENGNASISFRSQWNTVAWVTKTYTLNLRILGEENAAPVFKGTSNEISELVAVGESFTMNLTEAALWEDPELDDISYKVSVDDEDPVEANPTFYQFGPKAPGEYQLVFRAQDSNGNEAEETYTVNITAMTLTRFEIGGTAKDSWNADINRIDMGLAEVEEVIISEEEGVYAYVILDSKTDKEAKLFFRVKASASTSSRFHGVNINGKGVDGAQMDAANFLWSAEYLPTWNEYGEAALTFVAQPQNQNKYVYTLKLKIANEDNQAPAFVDGGSKTDSAEQYFDYTVDVASLFTDEDDSWLSYSVSVDNGETYVACGDSFTVTPQTTGPQTLKFKAKDIIGAESKAYVLTLNVSEYAVDENALAINKATENGELLSLTVKDTEGKVIEGIKFESTTEHKTESFAEDSGGSFAGQTFEWDETTIRVGLPENVGVSDKIVAHWHLVQNEAGLPFLSTADMYWDAVYNTKDGVATTLNGGIGSSTVRFYDAEVTYESHEWGDRYIVEYYIDRGENNQAPKLKEDVKATVDLTMDQYQTYSVDLSTIFEELDGDAVTYTVKVDDAEAVSTGKDYRRELTTDESVTLIFEATDALGASCTYTVNLTVNAVHRLVIETGEGAGTFTSGINKFYIYGQPAEKFVFTKDGWNRYITVQLDETVADDAEFELKWEGNTDGYNLTVDNPVKLVDGKAEFTFESTGHFFDKNHRYYNFSISNEPNNLPELAENVNEAVEEKKMVGTAYEVDLNTIFTDKDGDSMTYTVRINDAKPVAAEAAYSYLAETTGTYKLVFQAKDNWGVSEVSYTVTLVVANSDVTYDVEVKVPEAITPSFYASGSFDEKGQDILGDALTAVKGESADGWTVYTVKVPENISRISFRGKDGTSEWGGMSVATEKDMEPFAVRQVQAVINTKIDSDGEKVAPTADQVEFQVKYNVNEEGKYAVSGGTGTDTYGYLYYRFLLVAADNSLIYTYYTVPKADLVNSFGTNEGQTKTVTTESAQVMIQTLPLATKNAFTITVPSGATAVMYRQAGYFNYEELPVFETIDNGDGTKDMVFNNVGSKAIFRASMEGKVTKAGYSTASYGGAGSVVIDWDDDDRSPNYRAEYDPSTMMGSRGDDSMYVNVNYRNNLQLAMDKTFQLRAYRIWEIIDTDTTNIMIEPDFHYNIISGSDVIDIAPTDDVGGIAGKSWLDITPKKEGTAVLEVSYDAIDIISMSKMGGFSNIDEDFTFNASDPARTALVVVQVGAAENDINFGFDLNRADGWDVEFDTLYFTGEKGQIRLKPTVITDGEIAKVEVSGDKGMTYTELTEGEDGYYTANIVSGNNIIRVTKTDGSEHYHVVRGDKIEVVVTEVAGASDQDGIIDAGEKINIKFKGVHNVIGKMSGIYNPTGYKTNFTFNGETVSGNGGQYTYPQAAYVEVTIPGDAEESDQFVLTDGNTTNGGWGGSSGAHRSVKGEVPPGLDSDEVSHSGRNVFPEITLTVGGTLEETEQIAVESIELNHTTMELEVDKSSTLTASVKPVDATDRTVVWTSSDESIARVENGVVTAVAAGEAVITATAGKFSDSCEVTVIPAKEEEPSLDFGLDESEILGYVTVSFVDEGIRVEGEEMNAIYTAPLGTIVEATQVPFKAYDTVAGVTLRLLAAMGMTESHSGDEDSAFYLSAIGNFKVNDVHYSTMGEFDAGAGSGWMITLNGVFINKGASEFYVKEDDRIEWQYTCQLGADIGDTYSKAAVENVEGLIRAIGTVTLDKEDEITAARTAYDKLTKLQQSQVSNYAVLTAAEEELAALKATDEDKAAADAVEALISAIGTVTLESESKITAARAAYDTLTDTQKTLVENYSVLTAAEDALEALKSVGLGEMYDATAETLLGQTPDTGTVGGEWLVFGLARATDKELTSAQKAAYEAAVKAYINANINSAGQLNENKPTENERIALALTALGYDPTSYNGKNLLSALENTAWATKQGNNSTAFALLVINAANYSASNETALVNDLLNKQLSNGGWNITSGDADADTTAMAVQALAPYYRSNSNVKNAVDRALAYLAGLMTDAGILDDTSDSYAASVETVAQTIVALTELGRDPATDSQFTKNGKTLLDGLTSFYVKDGFCHDTNDKRFDQMSTEQAFYAMVAYNRYKNGQTSLYDMSDLASLNRVEILPCENGAVIVDKSSAMAGETITVTVIPDLGYQISKLTMNDAQLTVANDQAAFTMPNGIAILEAIFVKSQASAQAVAQAMTALEVKEADEETYDAIADIKKAYSKLTAVEKLEITEEYLAFQNKAKQFETYLNAHIDDAVEELEWFFDDLDEDDYSKKAWKKIEDLYEDALEAVKAARFEEEVYELLDEYLEELEEAAGGELEVTFRLIGDWKHDDGVSGHDEYVTWIETTEYNMPAGSTIYDLFIKAIDDFDLNQKGASKNYVESIQAPDILGGYWIGEFDNGPNSGWMYTINGDHPGYGLKEQDLEDGDEVIWHYADDYTLEERKPSSKYYERWLEADDISPETWVKRNLDKIVTIEGKGEVKHELKASHIGKDVKFTFVPAEGWVIKTVYVDGKDKGAVETYTYKDLAMDARIKVTFAPAQQAVYFVDVPEYEWFYDDVQFVVNNGLFNGTGEYTFSPNASMTRAMLVTVLYRLEGQPAVNGGSAFDDVEAGQWYTDAVIWATRNGIVNGLGNGKFGTNDNVTREQMAAILYRYAKSCGYDITARANLNGYTDANKISAYAQEAMAWANAVGLVNGRTTTSLAPIGTATRAEVAAIFHRFVENIVK